MLDMLTIAALSDELGRRLIGGRIQKTLQLDNATIGLEIYSEHQRLMLIASADNRSPRLYLSSNRVTADPDRVSPLLLLLRKYARGGHVVAIQQPPLERIVRISIAKRFWPDKNRPDDTYVDEEEDDDADVVYTDLIVELMGRRSNVILANDDGKILDTIKRVTPEMSRVRPILPGRQYTPPPPQEKHNPIKAGARELADLLTKATPKDRVADILVRGLAGFSPQMAREVAARATGSPETQLSEEDDPRQIAPPISQAIAEILAPLQTGEWEPTVYTIDDQPVAFAPIRLQSRADAEEEPCDSVSEAIERGIAADGQPQPVRHQQRKMKLVQEIHEAGERVAARLRSLEEEQKRAEEAERWREMGEMIYAYLYQIEPGQTELDVENYQIKLDPDLSPSDNAQAYFERYRKAQSAAANLPELVERARTELAYLRQMETLARFADGFDEIEQARSEWEAWSGRNRTDGKKPRKDTGSRRPRPLQTGHGDLIYIGRNGRQNDQVTFDIAGPDDIWLHARGMPGSHVILRPASADDPEAINKAASLAAWYSDGREATSVEVDVTERRHVRKIKGAGPGMVTYRNEQTVNVKPSSPEQLGLST